ncbi:LLM class flavin-dependent oxidoreductase [Kineococcus sp. SYSU DK004]|uniref:LLM class flavin-dependent oxidoreductase n=1 Tax=Kineococcus sp. SYSU DK004 TaxID=3383125 RepID=UPI003D7DA71A
MGRRAGRLGLGLLTFVPDHTGGAAALEHGLRLVELAEDLGYDTAWVRVRHHEPFLSSPMTFFAAASQRTRRVHLGTGVIPMRYEDPLRLAEDAATVDLLSGGRLELGVSGGIPVTASVLDTVHGPSPRGFSGEAQHRTALLRDALAGRAVGHAPDGFMSLPAGSDLRTTPHSPGLVDRLWYGAGSRASAARTGEQGLHLQVSTLNTEETGEPFDVAQAHQVEAYRAARAAAGHGDGRVSAGRILLPQLDARDEADHREFLDGYRSGMTADGRPKGEGGPPMRFSPALAGRPDDLVEALLRDAALPLVDELVVVLPANGPVEAHERILRATAEDVAPHMGWKPA